VNFPQEETQIALDGKANRTPAFLQLNPFGQAPCLKLEGGQGVFESNAIARYVARLGDASNRQGKKDVQLYGSNLVDASRIDSFLDAAKGLEENVGYWAYKAMDLPFVKDLTPQFIEDKKAGAKKSLAGFEQALSDSKYLVGNSITLADICWWCSVWLGFKCCFTKEFLADYPKVSAHFRHLEGMKEFQAVAKTVLPTPTKVELKFSAPAAPARYHRIATITDGKQSVRLKLYPESRAADVQEAIRTRFRLGPDQRIVLTDSDDCDVVADGTLETGSYTLHVVG